MASFSFYFSNFIIAFYLNFCQSDLTITSLLLYHIISAIEKRRSVRVYRTTPINAEVRRRIDEFINSVNEESGLCFKMVYDEPTAFTSPISYGKIVNVRNYVVVIGEKGKDFECGYYGEKIVIFLQTLGLNTCWAGISYKKKPVSFILSQSYRGLPQS